MKRWLIVMVLSVALAGCSAEAAAPPSPTITKAQAPVTINGAPFPDKVEVVEIDGRAYVPLAVVPSLADRAITWDGQHLAVSTAPLHAERPEIVSYSQKWREKIWSSLDLLERKAPDDYKTVIEHVAGIMPLAGDIEPDVLVGLANGDTNTIFVSSHALNVSDGEVASVIAHEAVHLKNAHTRPDLIANPKENERSAYQADVRVLKAVGAAAELIADAEKRVADPPTASDLSD